MTDKGGPLVTAKWAVLAISCLVLCATAGAQITLTENNIPRTIGDSFQFKTLITGSADVNVGSTGGPHTWTFDTASFPGMVVTMEIVDKATSPMGARFPDANVVAQQVYGPYGYWVYRKLDADQQLDLGMAMSNPDTLIGFRYDPAGVNIDLPFTLGTQWVTTFGYTDTTSDTTQSAILNTYDCRGDAWGTATSPAGTFPCLRENVFQTEITTRYLRGVVTASDTVRTRRFYWAAAGVGTIAMAHSMEGDTSTNFTLADDYMVLVQTNTGAVLEQPGGLVPLPARILPNPTTGSAELYLSPDFPGPATVRVCDAAGRVVIESSTANRQSQISLDLRGSPAGLYICTIMSGGRVITEPLVLLE
jgi:hypothetical protein